MSIQIRLVVEDDAEFILKLRNNSRLNQHLNTTSPNLKTQVEWIRHYKKREQNKTELYYLTLESGVRKGLYRIYNINNISFTIGSWVFDKCENTNLPVVVDLLMSDLGFYGLKKKVLLFDVRKDNKNVIRYHLMKYPLHYSEDELNNYYLILNESWENSKKHMLTFFGITNDEYEGYKAESGISNF